MAAANVLLPALAYVPESQPLPGGELPHNPYRRRYETDGGVYFPVTPDLYPSGMEDVPVAVELRGGGPG